MGPVVFHLYLCRLDCLSTSRYNRKVGNMQPPIKTKHASISFKAMKFIFLVISAVLYGVGDYIAQRTMANNENSVSDKVHVTCRLLPIQVLNVKLNLVGFVPLQFIFLLQLLSRTLKFRHTCFKFLL